MINREKKSVLYRVFDKTKDEYGQLKQSHADYAVDMMIKIMSQNNVEDPRFIDCDSIGITSKRDIVPGNQIIDGDKVYLIKYVILSRRFQQVFLKCEI